MAEKRKEKITPDEIPQVVKELIERVAPGGVITEAERKEKKGRIRYKVRKAVEAGEYEIKASAEGVLLEAELKGKKKEEISPDQMPDEVKETVERVIPGGEIRRVKREMSKGRVKYEVRKAVEAGEYEIEVAADGTLLEVELES